MLLDVVGAGEKAPIAPSRHLYRLQGAPAFAGRSVDPPSLNGSSTYGYYLCSCDLLEAQVLSFFHLLPSCRKRKLLQAYTPVLTVGPVGSRVSLPPWVTHNTNLQNVSLFLKTSHVSLTLLPIDEPMAAQSHETRKQREMLEAYATALVSQSY